MRSYILGALLCAALTSGVQAQSTRFQEIGFGGNSATGYGVVYGADLTKNLRVRLSGFGFVYEDYAFNKRNEQLVAGIQLQKNLVKFDSRFSSYPGRVYLFGGGGLYRNVLTRISDDEQELEGRIKGNDSRRPAVGLGVQTPISSGSFLSVEGVYQGIYRPEFNRVTYVGFGAGFSLTIEL